MPYLKTFLVLFNMAQFISKVVSWLTAPVGGRVIGMFRMLFGILMIYQVFYYIGSDLVMAWLYQAKIPF